LGRAILLGNSVNTDQIISGEFVRRDDYAGYLFKKFREDINQLVKSKEISGSIIVAGRNFGSGSSRERAATGLMKVGLNAVVARSYNPIWERNAVNCGLRTYRFKNQLEHTISDGNDLEISADEKTLLDKTTKKSYALMGTPQFITDIWQAGGLVETLRQKRPRSGR
jgi:3-isopropylmalate/(R)-2-methylmalate dehydratase small subunit